MSTFMQHQAEYGAFHVGETTEGTVILHPTVSATERPHYRLCRGERWKKRTGWYARLSAPGYLDCTDWVGPFETEEEADGYLGDYYDGDPLEEEIE